MNLPKHQFQYDDSGCKLICPDCKAKLTGADIEMYPYCPYCGHAFKMDAELEDFIIEPVARVWESRCLSRSTSGGR